MKLLKSFLTIAAVGLAMTVSAKADLLYLGTIPFDNPNSVAHNLELLENQTGLDLSNYELGNNIENAGGNSFTLDTHEGCYFVLHYGGKGGGSFEFFQVVNGETSVTISGSPFNGTPSGDYINPLNLPGDTIGNRASLSSIREFCPPGTNVPDSGTTAMLLGSALTGLGVARRYIKR